MDIRNTQPELTAAPTAPKNLSQPSLSRFITAARNAVRSSNTEDQLIQLLGELLFQYSACNIAFEVVNPISIDSNPKEPELKILFSQQNTCPESLQSWAFSTAAKACAQNNIVAEYSANKNSLSTSMIALPLVAETSIQPTRFLTVLFVGQPVEECMPFMQIAGQEYSAWRQARSVENLHHSAMDLAAIQEITASIGNSKSVQSACRKIANLLETQLSELEKDSGREPTSHTVYLGQSSGDHFPKLTAVSNQDSIPQDEKLIEAIEAAMAECVSRKASASWPNDDQTFALMCHKRASEFLTGAHVTTYPLVDREGKTKALLLVQSSRPLSLRSDRFLTTAQSQLGVSLSLVERGERNRLTQFLDNLKQKLLEKKTRTAGRILAAIFLLGLIPLPYQIKATTEVQPAKKTFLYAPFEAPLKKTLVEPGDIVLQGAELARLDEKELNLELEEIRAKLHRAEKKKDGFVASHEFGEARMARHEAEMLQARLELLEKRAEQLIVVSPVEGMVIAGDWKNSEGIPLDIGQSLFEIAPLEKLSIDVFLPEDDIRYAKSGQSVAIRFDAYPFETFHGSLERIHPAAEIRDSENIFVATVMMSNDAGKLRPGMKGNAKCSSVWRPIWWNLLHKPAAKCMRYFGW